MLPCLMDGKANYTSDKQNEIKARATVGPHCNFVLAHSERHTRYYSYLLPPRGVLFSGQQVVSVISAFSVYHGGLARRDQCGDALRSPHPGKTIVVKEKRIKNSNSKSYWSDTYSLLLFFCTGSSTDTNLVALPCLLPIGKVEHPVR